MGQGNMGLRVKAAILSSLIGALFGFLTPPALADSLDLSAYKGKVVYLDFWASWCNPCRLSFPWMNQVQQIYGSKGLVVIAVNVDHDPELAAEFLEANHAQFKVVYDPKGQIASKYDFKDMPTSILIGRDGKVRGEHPGFYTNREASYVADIDLLLNEKSQ
jgi:thiol-disulfide isomerase/thioredoxin